MSRNAEGDGFGEVYPAPGYQQPGYQQPQWGQQELNPLMNLGADAHGERLASLGRRFAGAVIDGFMSLAVGVISAIFFLAIFGVPTGDPETVGNAIWLAMLPGFALFFVICSYLTLRYGKTPAKFALGMKIVKRDGTPLDFKSGVLLRTVIPGAIGGMFPFFALLDGLFIFRSDERETVHDKFAGTKVIDDR